MLYQIYFYVPETSLDIVKQAMFNVGAGSVGDYQVCAWQTLGQGQFKPSMSATPYIGEQDKLTSLAEYRVEMVCKKHLLKAALAAMIQAHPYEEVAYGAYPITTLDDLTDELDF